MKKILTLLTALFLVNIFALYSSTVYAATAQVSPPSVSENSATATVTFSGLQSGRDYYYCLKGDAFTDCLDNGGRGLITKAASSEKIVLTVCGDGESSLKEGCDANDYFHGGKTYHLRLYLKKDDPTQDPTADASFTIEWFVPEITIAPRTGITPSTAVTISVTGDRWPFSGSNRDKRNNYQITIHGENGTPRPSSNEKCFTVPSNGTGSDSFTQSTGDYRIEVKEQVHEGDCDGGHLFKTFKFNVSESGGSVTGETGSGLGSGKNPCTSAGCDTAIGNIPTNIKAFATSILNIATGLAGGIALILMVFGSIQVLTSQGDQQKLNGGRERIIAAIAGLLFLIFSVLILKFIGINLLGGIPGF